MAEAGRDAAEAGRRARCFQAPSFNYGRHVTTAVGCYRYRFCTVKWNGGHVNSAIWRSRRIFDCRRCGFPQILLNMASTIEIRLAVIGLSSNLKFQGGGNQ
jgi:hypothetical protein